MIAARRPTETTSVIGATITLVTAFGLHLSGEQVGAISVFWAVVVVPGVTGLVKWWHRRKGVEQVWVNTVR